MSTLTVYRVEDAQGKGPYIHQGYRSVEQAKLSHSLSSRHSDVTWQGHIRGLTAASSPAIHPGPDEDHGMSLRWQYMSWSDRRGSRNYLFGFPSQRRLGEWFFGERDTLELLDMHVAAYEVAHQAVVRGQWQLAFRKQSARRVATMSLKEAGVE